MKLRAEPEDRGTRLDVFLARRLDSLTRSQVQILNRAGAVQIDGSPEKAGYRLRGGEHIDVDLDILKPVPLKAEQIPLQIIFEDTDMAVIDKPAGMVVHPGSGAGSGTMVHALMSHFTTLSDRGGQSRPGIVHRLDKWTSGLIVVAKNNTAHGVLAQAFHDRKVCKTYVALVHGKIARSAGLIDLSIGRHPAIRTRMAANTSRGRAARSEYEVVEYIGRFSLLNVRIMTGRTHQIRVHLSAIGHPVVGDDVYGESADREFRKKYGPLNRYFLHAAELRFDHPVTGRAMAFQSPLPGELLSLLQRLRSS
jgi:23S rRNA pseudouridine1911/1915/1917 synthase